MTFRKSVEKVLGETATTIHHPLQETRKLGRMVRLIPNSISSKVGRQALHVQKHSPTILFAGGVVGVVATTVLACRATLRLEEVLDECQGKMKEAREVHESGNPKYSDADFRQDMAYLYIRNAVKVTRLYGPSIVLGSVSIASLYGAHNVLSKRNVALTAAYAAVDKAFGDYRARVVEELGEDKDREFRYSTEVRKIADPDDARKTLEVRRVSPEEPSGYARFFDEYTKNWSPTPEYNLYWIRLQQNYANDMLRSRGHVFLNEVYDWLGIERSKAGQSVGWVLGPDGDNFIDFGLFTRGNNEKVRDFVNGREGAILLDFNVDGVILDKI